MECGWLRVPSLTRTFRQPRVPEKRRETLWLAGSRSRGACGSFFELLSASLDTSLGQVMPAGFSRLKVEKLSILSVLRLFHRPQQLTNSPHEILPFNTNNSNAQQCRDPVLSQSSVWPPPVVWDTTCTPQVETQRLRPNKLKVATNATSECLHVADHVCVLLSRSSQSRSKDKVHHLLHDQ